MRDRSKDGRPTEPINIHIPGNALFDRAVFAIGMDQTATRYLVAELLKAIGSNPAEMTPDELGGLLPLLEHRLRMMAPAATADRGVARVRQLLLSWED